MTSVHRSRRLGLLAFTLGRAALLAAAAFGAVIGVQLLRLRRHRFLPLHPGFWISHTLQPATGALPNTTPLRLVSFGDSTMAGVGVSRADEALPMLIAQRLADDERRPVRVLNYGWSGARVIDLVQDQVPRALQPRKPGEAPWLPAADVVLVVVGANDATHRTPPRRYRADLRSALATIGEAAPGARVVLAGIPRFRGALRRLEPLLSMVDAYAILLRRIGGQEAERAGVRYASLADEVPPLVVARGVGIEELLAEDHFHPSPLGYRLWADVIYAALRDVSSPPR